MLAAFDEGADSDEVHAKKGGKNKKDRQKKTKKKDSDDEAEEEVKQPEEKAEVAEKVEEAVVVEAEQPAYPVYVVYCAKCSLPAEYCSFGQKDISACKEWLEQTHPVLFQELYGEPAVEAKKPAS